MTTSIRTLIMALSLTVSMIMKAQVPLYSSHPSAAAVMFLDFDGHTVAGTSWNYNGPIVCGAAGLDNSQITEVFNRVAEDYRPFNINITTDSAKFLAAPVSQRMRVILTVSSSWYGAAGGVAFVGSFTWGDDNPCFVFSALLNYNVKNISEATAHEAGHTLGLYHQASYDGNCNKLTDYHPGSGAGEIGWAPIMGVGYYRNMTLWNNGPNPYGCSNLQSDLDIITSGTNGFGYRTDDHGSTFAGATTISFSNNEFTTSGIIERNTDTDMFRFSMLAAGRFQLDAIPYNVGTGNTGSDLDLQVTLYDNSQTVLNIYNPGTLLSSIVDTLINPGTYFIKIEGRGNQYAPHYASLGSYSLLGRSAPGAVLPVRNIELRGHLNGDIHELNWNIDADEQVIKQVIEISGDGQTFLPLTEKANDLRSHSYSPYNTAAARYRLNVTFDNGRQYYSNIVAIRRNGDTPRPQLNGTLIRSNALSVNSPGIYDFTLLDINGRIITKGKLANGINNINSGHLTHGMYIIRFIGHTQQWSDKFIRQ
ncbi:MAG: zinc-dependent metalloprotease [Chitinophagaceae bacterium]|nr:zinc-dependent metalloprotease [Chitinophagaceae bacterium]